MSVKIVVLDRLNRPLPGVTVLISWGGSTSNCKTDGGGIADLGCSAGTAKRILLDGDVVMEGDYYLKDGISRFNHPKK